MHHVGADLALDIDLNLLVRDPRGPDVIERLAGAGDALFEGILEADGGLSLDLGDTRNGHVFLLIRAGLDGRGVVKFIIGY